MSRLDVLQLWSTVGGCRCLGNHVSLQVRATIVVGQAVTRGEAVSLSRALNGSGTVDILCDCELPEL